MKKVIIFTSPTCAPCRMAKGFFDYHKIPYDEVDITTDKYPDDVSSVPTIHCVQKQEPLMEFTGFSQGIGNKIQRWYND